MTVSDSLLQMFLGGGDFVLYILLALSVVTLGVILERLYAFMRSASPLWSVEQTRPAAVRPEAADGSRHPRQQSRPRINPFVRHGAWRHQSVP